MQEKEKPTPEAKEQEATAWQDMKYERETKESER